MNAKVYYLLSVAGQKASILCGGDGKAEQTLLVEKSAPEFVAVVAHGDIGSDGSISWRYWTSCPRCEFDRPQTVAELLAHAVTETERRDAEKHAAAEAKAVETLAVLRERRTAKHEDSYTVRGGPNDPLGSAKHRYEVAAWPYNADAAVMASPEAVAWLAELDAAKAAALVVADAEARADLAAKLKAKRIAEEKKAANDAKRAAWREANGIEDGDICLRIEDGALVNVPPDCWESHKRGKNWLAIITADPSKPGGLERRFAAKAKGDSYYIVPTLNVGDAVEFGADYYSGGGSKRGLFGIGC